MQQMARIQHQCAEKRTHFQEKVTTAIGIMSTLYIGVQKHQISSEIACLQHTKMSQKGGMPQHDTFFSKKI